MKTTYKQPFKKRAPFIPEFFQRKINKTNKKKYWISSTSCHHRHIIAAKQTVIIFVVFSSDSLLIHFHSCVLFISQFVLFLFLFFSIADLANSFSNRRSELLSTLIKSQKLCTLPLSLSLYTFSQSIYLRIEFFIYSFPIKYFIATKIAPENEISEWNIGFFFNSMCVLQSFWLFQAIFHCLNIFTPIWRQHEKK